MSQQSLLPFSYDQLDNDLAIMEEDGYDSDCSSSSSFEEAYQQALNFSYYLDDTDTATTSFDSNIAMSQVRAARSDANGTETRRIFRSNRTETNSQVSQWNMSTEPSPYDFDDYMPPIEQLSRSNRAADVEMDQTPIVIDDDDEIMDEIVSIMDQFQVLIDEYFGHVSP
ncbi:hypothetical protein evm_004314 [Chilo suppressalis]|nr:hypothetical protein evm_004314 [Chilo suppressalis]